MNVIFVFLLILFSISAIVSVATIPRARTIDHEGTRNGFVAFLLSVGIWSGGYVGYLLAPTIPAKQAFYIIGFIFAFIAVGAFLYLSATYSGRPPEQMPFRKYALAGFLGIIMLKITNPIHNLYFTSEWVTDPFPHLAIQHGLLYWIVLGVSYAGIAIGFYMLLELFYHTGTDTRPLVVLLAMTAVPTGATILSDQIPGMLTLMYEPPGVAIFAVGTLFVYKTRFEAIRFTGGSDKPAIFLDMNNQIRDYNQSARAIFPDLEGSVGNSIESVNPSLSDNVDHEGTITIPAAEEQRFYQVTTTPFTSGAVKTGQLVTITDVTDEERYRQKLEKKTEQLEALNRVVRHDIRNDIAVVLGWAQNLEAHIDAEGKDSLARVIQKSHHIIELTETAREFVDSLSSDEDIELKPIDLATVIETELATVRNTNPEAHFRVTGTIPETHVQANEMLSSVFRNIFENAIRHTDEQTPEITLVCEEAHELVRIKIADNGPGIPDEQKAEIFGKGEKGLESPGTGIGLYLVHTLVTQYGGEVWVEDNEPTGAIFVVELPIVE